MTQIEKIKKDVQDMETALSMPSVNDMPKVKKRLEVDLETAKGLLAELLQKKTEEPKPVQAQQKQDQPPQQKPIAEREVQNEQSKDELLEWVKTAPVEPMSKKEVEAFVAFKQGKIPKPTPKAPAKIHREFLPGLYIEEPATLGQLEVNTEDSENRTTLDIPMVNGTILTATYGIAKARSRQYFDYIMNTEDFREKRYAAVLKSAMFKNLVRLVRGWGVLKSIDVENPDYPMLNQIFKIQKQTREERVQQAKVLYDMVMEKIKE